MAIPGQAQSQALEANPQGDDETRRGVKNSSEVSESTLPRKAAMAARVPVPQTDTGRRGENPQSDGRSVVKELGKMTP